MNVLDFYTRIYGKLKFKFLPFWVLTPVRRLIRMLANKHIPIWFEKTKFERRPEDIEKNLIVSFTSFPARIDNVWKVVESLKRQTVQPEKIILWLSKDQFPSMDTIPESLLKQRDELFEIRMVDGDVRSHKKYYYMLLNYQDKVFITCDDDNFYDPNMIKRLVDASKVYPHCIIANHTAKIKFDEKGEVLSYAHFEGYNQPFSSDNLMQIGIGGVLYPPYSLHEMVKRSDLFMQLAPLADDIWLNAMSRLNKTPVVQSSKDPLNLPIIDNAPTLSEVNNGKNRNDIQLNKIKEYLLSHGKPNVFKSTWDVKCD